MRYIFVKSIKIGPLISHIFRITNHRSLFFLKTSIYIQIVIRWASIHRLSICIIDLPTTVVYTEETTAPLLHRHSSTPIPTSQEIHAPRQTMIIRLFCLLATSLDCTFSLPLILIKISILTFSNDFHAFAAPRGGDQFPMHPPTITEAENKAKDCRSRKNPLVIITCSTWGC